MCSLCNGFRQVHALLKIIFSCMNNMFWANTIMGKYCHLCLEHDYTITFPACQAHLSPWQVGAVFLYRIVIRTHTIQRRHSWKTLVTVTAKSWKPLILLGFSGVHLHVARWLSRNFLANFSQVSRNFRMFSNPFWIGSVTIWDNLIAYGGISKRS